VTVENDVSKVIANGNGATTVFSFSPVVLPTGSSELVVIKTSAAGVETTLTEGTGTSNYSVSVSEYPGTGSITYPASGGGHLATGEKLTMARILPLEQPMVLDNQGGYFPKNQELAFDKLVMIDQQLQEQLARAVLVPISSGTDPADYLAEIAADVASAEAAADSAAATLASVSAVLSAAITSANEAAAAAEAASAVATALATGVTIDTFSGTGAQTAFTLGVAPPSKSYTDVHIDGIYQDKSTYGVVGTTLTFLTAPPPGTGNIEVKTGAALGIGVPGDDSVGADQINGSDAAAIRAKLGVFAATTLGDLALLDTVGTAEIDNASVTFAKMQSASTVCLLGATGANPFQQLGIGTGLALNTGTGVLSASGVTNSSVGQAQLKTSYSEASVLAPSNGTVTVDFVTAGGEYGFAPVWKTTTTGIGGVTATAAWRGASEAENSFAQYFTLTVASNGPGDTGVGTIRQRYISASPPYDWGDGPMDSFIFVQLEPGTGRVLSLWAAQDPPWAYNGPTRTRPNAWVAEDGEVFLNAFDAANSGKPVAAAIARRTKTTLAEARQKKKLGQYLADLKDGELHYRTLTMADKMRDMAAIPHPFAHAPEGRLIAVLDPMLPTTQRLVHLMRHADEADGYSVSDMIFNNDVKIDNEDLVLKRRRKAPPGVMLLHAEVR
jgi:hypothetical protein